MPFAREMWSRMRGLFEREIMERELDEEMRFHLEKATERNVKRGMSADEARREALLAFGGMERFKEAARAEHRSRPLEDFWQDLRYGVRTLRRTPLFATVAVISLAVGIGANTAIFSVVDGVLLRPLPVPEPDRLMRVGVHDHGRERPSSFSVADLRAVEAARSFASVGAVYREGSGIALTGGQQAETIPGSWITAGVLAAVGVPPALGRGIQPEEDEAGAARVVVLSDEFWRDRFASSREAIGRALMLDGEAYTIVGVMPPGFRLPGYPRDDVWPALQLAPPEWRAPFFLHTFARLAPGVSQAQARAELGAVQNAVKARFPEAPRTWDYAMSPLKDVLVRDTRTTILVLFGAVALVLLIAAANVANLLLARATTRAPELAVRTALGAGRGRLMRQLLTESILISLLGAIGGLVLAYAGVAVLGSFTPGHLPRFHEITVERRVLLFTAVVALLTGALVGLAPALRVPRSVAGRMGGGGRGGTEGRERARMRGVLVVAEFALALTLLIGAGLLVNSLMRLQEVDPGAQTHGVLTVRLSLPQARYPEDASVAGFYDQLVERVQRIPGVRAAAVSMGVPPNRLMMTNPFTPEGRTYGAQETPPRAEQLLVSPGYFDALRIPILRGRAFAAMDRDDAPRVTIINESMARRYFPGRDPLGRWIQLGDPNPEATRWVIVGIVPDVSYDGLHVSGEPTVYVPYAQNLWWRSMYLIVRTTGEPLAIVPAVRSEVATLDPQVPLREVRTVDALMREAVAEPRFRTLLLGGFAAIALLLATAGIYGVMSYSANQRRRETGIRLALGARPADIVRLLVGQGMRLAAFGVMLGLLGAVAVSGALRSMLFGVGALDPATFAGAAGVLAVVGLLACYVPAARASRADAAMALRTE